MHGTTAATGAGAGTGSGTDESGGSFGNHVFVVSSRYHLPSGESFRAGGPCASGGMMY